MDGDEELFGNSFNFPGGNRSSSPNLHPLAIGGMLNLGQDIENETSQDSASSTSGRNDDNDIQRCSSSSSSDNINDLALHRFRNNESRWNRSPVSSINKIPINFPGHQNSNHSQILDAVTQTLCQSQNLLLECLSDAERRLAGLCGALSFWQWTRQEMIAGLIAPKNLPSIIFYLTNSFESAKQIVSHLNEMGQTGQLDHLQMAVLGERKDLCVNVEVIQKSPSKDLDTSCLRLMQNSHRNRTCPQRNEQILSTCSFYSSQDSGKIHFVRRTPIGNHVVDIEELKANFRQTNTCPYLDISKRLQGMDLVICSQEFILSSILREDYLIDLNRAILIFDDAYNIEKSCYEEGSIIITSAELREAGRHLENIANSLNVVVVTEDVSTTEMKANFRTLELSLSSLADWMRKEVKRNKTQEDILQALKVRFVPSTNGVGDSLKLYRQNLQVIMGQSTRSNFPVPDTFILKKVRKLLTVLGYIYSRTNSPDYYITLKPSDDDNSEESVLNLICANASVIFKPISDLTHSIILGSSCLAPVTTIKSELGVEFHETLELSDNVIQGSRRLFGLCDEGPNNIPFSLKIPDRGDAEVKLEVGEALLALCKVTPGGVLAFFHSRDYMHEILSFWEEVSSGSGECIMSRLNEVKHVVNLYNSEYTSPDEVKRLVDEYRLSNSQPDGIRTGGLLLALHRSEIYEKMDFNDQHMRLIIHVSLPFGNWPYDLNFIGKRKYFQSIYGYNCKENLKWFRREALRILNQSFVKSTQQSNWGAVVVLDDRMAAWINEFDSLLPAWVPRGSKNGFRYCKNFRKLTRRLEYLVNHVD